MALNRAQPVNYPEYMFEILAHAGLCFARVEPANLREELSKLKILLTVGEQEFDDALKQALGDWVRSRRGAWLSVGGVCGMSELLGVQNAIANYPNWGGGAVVLGEGYMLGRDQHHPAIAHLQARPAFFRRHRAPASCARKSLPARSIRIAAKFIATCFSSIGPAAGEP